MASSRAINVLFLIGLLLVPFMWDSFVAYQLGLFLLYGMVGQGIGLCWGRAGFLPLGQALFFGVGAYVFGFALKLEAGPLILVAGLLAAILLPALIAFVVGFLVFIRQIGSGPYFSLITLALTMLGFQLANSMDWLTGGFNGMTGIPALPGTDTYETLYYVIWAALVLVSGVLAYVGTAPFGQLLGATAQNEERLQYFGVNTALLKAIAFAISAAVAGLAGALFAPHQGIVTPQSVGFLLSAEIVVWTAVGGRASLMGPVLGAILIGFMASELRDSFQYWEVLIALVFVVVVIRFPGGLWSLVEGLARRLPSIGAKGARKRDLETDKSRADGSVRLAFEDVELVLGPVRILDKLSFRIDTPGVHSIIGPNGAGKTSAFNVLTGRLKPTAGRIEYNGATVGGLSRHRIARKGIARKLQIPSVFPDLSVDRNLDIALWAGNLTLSQMFTLRPFRWSTPLLNEMYDIFPFLEDGRQPAGSLSLGQRQMLDFAMTCLTQSPLLLLDEPCAGLSSSETGEMIDAIERIVATTGSTAIIIEHDMQVVERLSNHVLVLNQGALLANGAMEEIRSNPAVQAVYGGGSK
ncbi:ATP-binding cassette domain-containing protein [Hoeflea sp. WL0058]|uniref:ATP-binding cassette domain-containing protein n=1 Tax=Flavimaribacter sediminis TaxID=2865987 RepID=A0AAE2ZP99_9HYPH|nr:ATP-binding cassette domain-containing protein [Flavimaribacter sediminis]MBW8638415.1 ATP-binding cassette domain-containing protein [Flavimaribacter sediminis]